MEEDWPSAVVLDMGGYSCKAGLAGESEPRLSVRTLVALAEGRAVAYGRDCLERPIDNTEVKRLVSDGRADIDRVGGFWKALSAVDPQLDFAGRAALVARSPFASLRNTFLTAELFFEELRTPFYHSAAEPLLALYSSGRVTGLVLSAGEDTTSATPICDGVALSAAQSRDRFGGRRATELVERRLGFGERAAAEFKESDARVSLDFEQSAAECALLPDGQRLAAETALLAAESPFRPSLLGSRAPGAAEVCFEALLRVDSELRREVAANVIPVGGNCALANFNERLLRELSALLPGALKAKCYELADKQAAVWSGGAAVAGLAAFRPQWVARAEYEEHGPAALLRKCA